MLHFSHHPASRGDMGEHSPGVIGIEAGLEQSLQVAGLELGPVPGLDRETAQRFQPLIGERARSLQGGNSSRGAARKVRSRNKCVTEPLASKRRQ